MKKVLSLLLSLVLLIGIAAPLAHAAGDFKVHEGIETEDTVTVGGKELTVYTLGAEITAEPVTVYEGDIVIIVLNNPNPGREADPDDPDDEGEDPDEFQWHLDLDKYVVALRVLELDKDGNIVDYQQYEPSNLVTTYGTQMFAIVGSAPGNNTLIVEKITRGEDKKVSGRTEVGTLEINVQEKQDEDDDDQDQPDLWFILKMYCNELKWFWEYNVHPTFKAIYFAIRDWFANLGNTIKGWFECDDTADLTDDEVIPPAEDTPPEDTPPEDDDDSGEVTP